MLKVKNMDVYYGGARSLTNVSIEVNKGELVSLIGSNGAGKTTMLKAISGLVRPASGCIEFLGVRIDNLPAHKIARMGISHVPEGRRTFPELTVMENLELGAYFTKKKDEMKEQLKLVFDLFPILEERESQVAGTLSGGESQMLAIGRGLMQRPRLLLLDEPSLGLAPILVRRVFELIEQIHKQGITTLLVEQNVQWALSLCNRGYVLESGRVVLQGRGDDLLADDHVREAYLSF